MYVRRSGSGEAAVHLVREFCGYLMGVAFCMIALALCGLGWLGMESEFGWKWALAAVVAGAVVRVNAALPIGLFLYASNVWDWPMPQALAFSAPGLILLLPSLATSIFVVLVGRPATRY